VGLRRTRLGDHPVGGGLPRRRCGRLRRLSRDAPLGRQRRADRHRGASIGLRRFREAAWTIAALGVLGTFATAGLLALFAHWALGLAWITSGLLAAAIAPTDPAVVFSLLGERGVGGRVSTILEGESGANDPVGIALMLGLLELATHADKSFWVVIRIFAEQMAIGLAAGVLGGLVGRRLLHHVRLRTVGLLTNPPLLLGIASEIVFVALLVYVPPLQVAFRTAALPGWVLLALLPCPVLVWSVDELFRLIDRRRQARRALAHPESNGLTVSASSA